MTLDQLHHAYTTDPTKLDTLLTKVRNFACSLARRRGHDDPEDVAQRVLLYVWERWGKPNGAKSFGAWVWSVTMNTLQDDRRQRTKKKRIDIVSVGDCFDLVAMQK
jgi:RNA polymerase sigma factor (sigma-70 family)